MEMIRRALGLGERPKETAPQMPPAAESGPDISHFGVDNQIAGQAVREALIDSVLDFHLRRPDREPKH